MHYWPLAGLTTVTLISFLTYEILYRAHEDYVRVKNNLIYKVIQLDKYVGAQGYPFKSYSVTTEDDYVLEIHRIPQGKHPAPSLKCGPDKADRQGRPTGSSRLQEPKYNSAEGSRTSTNIVSDKRHSTQSGKSSKCVRLPALIVHGVLGCSGTMMVHNSSALAYVLADAGYDTWLYNARGTMYSRGHKVWDPDKDIEYWEFSYHEMGYYDLPAAVDLVLKKTGCLQVILIGYSMGNSVAVAFLADRPQYQDKVAQFFALAPAVFLNHMESSSVDIIANFILHTQKISRMFKIHEVFTQNPITQWGTALVCGIPGLRKTCVAVLKFTGGYSGHSMDEGKLAELMRYVPAGVSLRTLEHLAQQLTDEECFRKFDYGPAENQKRYKSATAPCYDLRGIQTPVCVYHGAHDSQVTQEDAIRFAKAVPNLSCRVEVPFNHFDFMWSYRGRDLVYQGIVDASDRLACATPTLLQ